MSVSKNCVELSIKPRKKDLGGFSVGRVLPSAKRRMVGPFIFFDEMGPAKFSPGKGIDVRPHPHIGLATITYLITGEMLHNDSLGSNVSIHPGDVNWMTAGNGIVHSERTAEKIRKSGQSIHGIQSWVALPEDMAEKNAEFHHYPKATLPTLKNNGLLMRIIAGNAFNAKSPVKTFSDMFYVDVEAEKDSHFAMPDQYEDRALYILTGTVEINGQPYSQSELVIFKTGASVEINVTAPLRGLLLGGQPLEKKLIWWNFVASNQQRLDKAKADWIAGTESNFTRGPFRLPPGEEEFIPLPDK